MDATFYDDSCVSGENNNNMKGAKRPGTLPLDNKPKKAQLLTSPDVKALGLGTPEIERIILNNSTPITSTQTPVQHYLFPSKPATEEQKQYVEPFERILAHLHGSSSTDTNTVNLHPVPPPIATSSSVSTELLSSDTGASTSNDSYQMNTSSDSRTYDATEFSGVTIKEEPQTVPQITNGTPPVSPIDMRDQERIKLERKRLRNRIAASKCRKRKLERISKLEDEVNGLKNENNGLSATIASLREQVKKLHQEVNSHVISGCKLDVSNFGT